MYWMRVFVQKISDDACTLESCSSFYFYSGFLSIFFFLGGGYILLGSILERISAKILFTLGHACTIVPNF